MNSPTPAVVATDAAPTGAQFRTVMGHYPTGVCVVTTMDPDSGHPTGMTIGSFTSVSMDPPLVAFFPMNGSSSFSKIAESGLFCVNVLSRDQEEYCRKFASREPDKFVGISWRLSRLGSPILDGVLAWVDCKLERIHEAGDHLMVLGAVESLSIDTIGPPLMFFRGGYGGFTPMSLVADSEHGLAAHLRLAELARPHLESMSSRFGVESYASAAVDDRVIQVAWVAGKGAGLANSKVGMRLPLLPPMDLLFVAWSDDAQRRRWLQTCAAMFGSEVGDQYAGVLEKTRSRGWIATPDHASLRTIEATVRKIASAGPSAGLDRSLEAQLRVYAEHYPRMAGSAQTLGAQGAVSAPVFDASGSVVLVVTVHGNPTLEDDAFDPCLTQLKRVSDVLTRQIGGSPP